MKVVCNEEAEEPSTARNSTSPTVPPSTGPASAAKTLSAVSGFPSPTPSVPTPANICAATATST